MVKACFFRTKEKLEFTSYMQKEDVFDNYIAFSFEDTERGVSQISRATDEHKLHYPKEWRAFEESEKEAGEDTPVDPIAKKDRKSKKDKTVE